MAVALVLSRDCGRVRRRLRDACSGRPAGAQGETPTSRQRSCLGARVLPPARCSDDEKQKRTFPRERAACRCRIRVNATAPLSRLAAGALASRVNRRLSPRRDSRAPIKELPSPTARGAHSAARIHRAHAGQATTNLGGGCGCPSPTHPCPCAKRVSGEGRRHPPPHAHADAVRTQATARFLPLSAANSLIWLVSTTSSTSPPGWALLSALRRATTCWPSPWRRADPPCRRRPPARRARPRAAPRT